MEVHTAWNGYNPLPSSTKIERKQQTADGLVELRIPTAVAEERVTGKFLQLETPKGKVSDERKRKLERDEQQRLAKKLKRASEGELGLVGRRKRANLDKAALKHVSWETASSLHLLWLQYMQELLGLQLQTSSLTTLDHAEQSSSRLASFTQSSETRFNVQSIQTKLVKAEFVGAKIKVKKARNVSLINLEGVVVQETLGTFKVVTCTSKAKILPKRGAVLTFSLPIKPATSSTTLEHLSFDIYGDSLCYRSSDRVGKKWKNQNSGIVDV